jgi:CheY-like chemotaxis protein
MIDRHQLENAIVNLCINARDAMPDGGEIVVDMSNVHLDARTAEEFELDSGDYIAVSVSDTGTGMTPEIAARAFDPFFTTKPIGQGTGLGLSMIYGFARQSGGHVSIETEVGRGSTVSIYLPRSRVDVEPSTEVQQTPDAPLPASGVVLVVEDEAALRMLITEVLEDKGYTTIEASDGPNAMKLLQSNMAIDMMITDVGMPGGMNGRQLADAAQALRTGLHVLLITGYAESAATGEKTLGPGMHLLTKPFPMTTLLKKVGELIGATG